MMQNTDPDPHGQAALMLCEGLMLLMLEQSQITKSQVTDVIDGIVEIKREIAGTTESTVVSIASIALLRAVQTSMAAAPDPLPDLALT